MGADDPVDIVAWSNGARASLDFALHHPERVRSVTAVEPAAWWLAGEEREDVRAFTEFFASVACRDLSEEDLIRFLVDVGVAPAQTPWRDLAGWPLWYSCRNALSWFTPESFATIRAGISDLAALDVPLLLFKGSSGAAHFADTVDVIAATVGGARAATLEGGHACHLQDAEGFVRQTLAHLAT
ncbi:alpha/beta fold hydrolase [Nocardioides jiangxiensis]|uniref:Alpha/beta hydrolase n=1 Tax=Nocardioides jiangxiensis TaxID=3064524 RepID=A0ABT9AYF7_9ACTN|nr:alpha/beta hydrolase [Nocardioides sp. WY-20]MDO7867442.1 alpha/beta hydrolase [Nocardioides sp. WY-20]